MRKRLIALVVSAVTGSSIGIFAQAASTAGQSDRATTRPAQTAQPASTTLRARGTIDKYDASTRILSLSTSSGTVQFPIASGTRIRQGWHRIEASELQKLAGDRATVRYTESGDNKVVESVHVFGR